MDNNSSTDNQQWIHTDSTRPPETCGRISRYLKGEGRNALLGHMGTAIGANIVYCLLVIVLTALSSSVGSYTVTGLLLSDILIFITGILSGVLAYGLAAIYMNLQYGQLARFTDLFTGFRENSNKIVVIEAVLILLQMACLLPSSIVGLFAYSDMLYAVTIVLLILGYLAEYLIQFIYAMALYVLLDYPDLSCREVLKRSRSLMKGHLRHYIYLELSFLPLYLLSVLSLGVAAIPVFAYEQSTIAAFYKGRMENRLMG